MSSEQKVTTTADQKRLISGLFSEAKVLWSLLRGQPGGSDHAERLTAFYGPQAAHYDVFRERLLHGRGELLQGLWQRLAKDQGSTLSLLELGAGTGRNLSYLGESVTHFDRIDLVDLCEPLLDLARSKWQGHEQVHFHLGDATTFQAQTPVDAIYFSYALTMIPNWFQAIDNAIANLKPGGWLGVVDFYVSRRYPNPGAVRHSGFSRHFWPAWFAHDGVRPNQDLLPYLQQRLRPELVHELQAKVPYLPGLRVPYFLFVGQKV
jgi:S-adenosylmethionine-diacylgycerolhomoserine-N-methlytransferase